MLKNGYKNNAKFNDVKKKLKDYQTFVKKILNLLVIIAYEARSIHYDNKK